MLTLPRRAFGATGIEVSALGLGAGSIGDSALDEAHAEHLLHGAVDMGVTLIDAARSYGLAEARIGRYLHHRRHEIVLSTKVGYGITGFHDWTGPCVSAGIDEALRRLCTDYIDIVHLHSCPLGTLEYGEVLAALERAVAAGKVRAAAYSGDNQELGWAVRSGRVASVQTSISMCDQWSLEHVVPEAHERRLGVIAKRPLANAPWRFAARPSGHECEPYWERWRAMNVDEKLLEQAGVGWHELAARFAAFQPGVHAMITGTTRLENLEQTVQMVNRGPLPAELVDHVRQAFRRASQGQGQGQEWTGRI